MLRSILIKAGLLVMATGIIVFVGQPWSGLPRNVPDLGVEGGRTKGAILISAGGAPTSFSPTKPRPQENPAKSHPKLARSRSVESLLDINHSTVLELQALPGIGPILAQRIVDQRELVGGFHTPEELRKVRGLGAKRIEGLKPLIQFMPSTKDGRKESR